MADSSTLTIRPETAQDRHAIAAINEAAFGRPAEARLIEALRAHEGFDAALSLVADEDGTLLGHILLSPILIRSAAGDTSALALAPMAVVPERQNEGVGGRLVRAALGRAGDAGHGAVIVLGHPDYYPRFGFKPASAWGVTCPFEVPGEAFMLVELAPGRLPPGGGMVEYPTPFLEV